jgi:hypothetical protein
MMEARHREVRSSELYCISGSHLGAPFSLVELAPARHRKVESSEFFQKSGACSPLSHRFIHALTRCRAMQGWGARQYFTISEREREHKHMEV